MAGAERLVLEEFSHLSEEFRLNVTVLESSDSASSDLVRIARTDPRELLSGCHDVVHTHLFLPGLIARARRSWDSSFRWVHSLHYHHYEGLSFPRMREWLDRKWVFPAADAIIAVSPGVMDSLGAFPQAVFIENALDMTAMEAPAADGLPPVVGTVAMLRREKGLHDLVQAAAHLRDRGIEARIRIAGEGPLRADLEDQIQRLDLANRVELCGYVTDLASFYRGLAVYVQPSISESFGLAALEALRYRRPFVGTGAGHLPVILDEGRFGLLVSRAGDTPAAIADGIAQALEDRSGLSQRAEAGRAYWVGRLDPKVRARRGADVYRQVLLPRVCFVTPLATHGGGGLQRQVEIQSRALAKKGHRIFLLQRRDERLRSDDAHGRRWRHITLLETADVFRASATGGLRERLRGIAFVVLGLARLIGARARYDVIHAQQLYSPTLVGALAKRLLGKPLVVRVTASGELGELRELRRLPFRRIRGWAFRQVDRVVVLTETMRREVLQLGFDPERVVCIPNAVEIPDAPAQPEPLEDRPFRLVYVGRLSTEKSLETLLAAAAILADGGRSVEVTLVGGGAPQRDATPALEAQAAALPDGASVVFRGSTDDVASEYRRADAFVLPSVSEGMSNALLEAMSHGLVCLASDIPENRAVVVDGQSGILFSPGDASCLAGEILALIDDRRSGGSRSAQLREGARARIRAGFSPDQVVAALESVYADVMRRQER